MTRLHVTLAVALSVALVPAVSSAQSLGEVARKTKEKRKDDPKPAKVITESELRNSKGNANIMGGQSGEAETDPAKAKEEKKGEKGEAAGGKEKSPDELKAEAEAAWREKLQKAEADVTRLEGVVSERQAMMNDITGPLYGPGRAQRAQQLEEAQAQLAAAKQQVADLQEEGRRSRFR